MSLPQSEIDERLSYAKGLTDYEKQRAWYSERATALKRQAQLVDLTIIGIGALIAAVPSLIAEGYVPRVVSALGILIAVLQGGQRIYRSGEIWPQYREAAEAMKREMRLFAHGTGAYAGDAEAAKSHYKARLEEIIAGEQKTYFEAAAKQGKSGTGKPPAKA